MYLFIEERNRPSKIVPKKVTVLFNVHIVILGITDFVDNVDVKMIRYGSFEIKLQVIWFDQGNENFDNFVELVAKLTMRVRRSCVNKVDSV